MMSPEFYASLESTVPADFYPDTPPACEPIQRIRRDETINETLCISTCTDRRASPHKIEKLPPPSLSFSLEDLQQFGPVQDQMTRAGNPLSASQHKVSRETERPRAALIFTISQVYNSSRNRRRRQRQQQQRRGSQDIKQLLSVSL